MIEAAKAVAAEDVVFMRRALDLATRARGRTRPNPMVGCVVVRDGAVVGEGFHSRAGEPHAEIMALQAAGAAARGATAYVTLEPCDHVGRTGPCSRALVQAGIARVVAAMPDPNPLAAGGHATLREAGVRVDLGVCLDEALALNDVFVVNVTQQRPHVTLKAAVSLDGRIAASDGSSRWITGDAARARVHALRGQVDAVLVGSGTVLADDPQLTCRIPGWDGPQPLRVVLDRRGRVGPAHRVRDSAARTLILDEPDVGAAVKRLWERGVRSVLVEGGADILAAFLRDGPWDRLLLHVAPVVLGHRGHPLLRDDAITSLAHAPRFRIAQVEQVGDDALLTVVPSHAEATRGASRAGAER